MELTGIALIIGAIVGVVAGHVTTLWWQVVPLRVERDNWRALFDDAWEYASTPLDDEWRDDDDEWDMDDEFEWKLTEAGKKMAEGE